MSIDDKNKGLFGKFKKSADQAATMEQYHGQEPELEAAPTEVDPKQIIEQELIKRLSAEKHRLAAELEIKFKEASAKRMQAQEQKFKQIVEQEKLKYQQLLAKEKQQFQQALKDKYNRVMKTMLHEREQAIADKYKKDYYTTDVELRQQIEKLKQELTQHQQNATLQVTQAAINAKKEQEQASRTLYDSIMQSNRNEIMQQTESKLQAEFLRKEADLKREHEINLKKHTAKLINTYEDKLREALIAQEQALSQANNEQLSRQSDLFNHRVQQEVQTAVDAATSKLELEFVKEKQALNAIIESLRPEVEANRLRMRVEVEKELREEFEVKFAQYKQKVDDAKQIEIEALLTTEKQKLAESLQEENMVVLRYKEREIREGCASEFAGKMQEQIQLNLQEQEKRLRAEHAKELESIISNIKADHAQQLHAEIIQERARVTDKATSEKKILLQQQQTNLQEQFESELAHRLAMQAQNFKQQYEVQINNLESKLLELQNKQSVKQVQEVIATQHQSAPAAPAYDPFDMDNQAPTPTIDYAAFEADKQQALRAQEEALRAEFAQHMQLAREQWQQQTHGLTLQNKQDELVACERRLRKEFQAILEQQRMQAAANFAKQRDVELRGAIARYKQKLLKELETARVNDLAASEEALKEQYAARMQQHNELSRVEIERAKEKLQAEQAEKIQNAVDLQLEVILKEQDRKFALYAKEQDSKMQAILAEEQHKLQVKFAQDKANLIKDLTAKFTREKHIAMNKYETELREKLYKEMVKQKEFIQQKFTQAQEAALLDQKRRLESQHKHEIERIKQGFFDPAADFAQHDQIIAERSVEQLADKILSKFHKNS